MIVVLDLETATTFSKAFVLALLDSNRTDQLLVAEEITSVDRMTALLPSMYTSEEGRAIMSERPALTTKTVDLDALRVSPEGTLGRALVHYLDSYGLDLDALAEPVTRGVGDANYLLERTRQTHDVWHALLELGAAGHEEVLVHAFQWSQLRMPYSALVAIFGSLKHMVGERRWPMLRHTIGEAYRAGAEAEYLLPIYWERHWDEPIAQLRSKLRIRPASSWRGFSAQAAA